MLATLLVTFSVSAQSDDIVEHETGFYYTIQEGDTLWGLSQRFSDSAWFWPDLWKENSQIANPHWIYPGNRIRIYRKDWSKKMETPVKTAHVDIFTVPEPIHYFLKDIDMVGFIRKEAVPPSASIFKVKDEKVLISQGDLVFLRKENENQFVPGSLYIVYRTFAPIKNKDMGGYIGIQHYFTGLLEIIKEDPEFATGKIIKSFRPIYINDKLMPFRKRGTAIPITPFTKEMDGTVVCSEENLTIFGDHDIAFINKGKNDGVEIGQFFKIYEQEKVRLNPESNKSILLDAQDFGELFVLHTEDTTSTVIITQSDTAISSGDKIHAYTE